MTETMIVAANTQANLILPGSPANISCGRAKIVRSSVIHPGSVSGTRCHAHSSDRTAVAVVGAAGALALSADGLDGIEGFGTSSATTGLAGLAARRAGTGGGGLGRWYDRAGLGELVGPDVGAAKRRAEVWILRTYPAPREGPAIVRARDMKQIGRGQM